MKLVTRSIRAISVIALTVSVAALAACSTSSSTKSMATKPVRPLAAGKEYFPEALYGKASPRVTNQRSGLQRGGGRDQIGKPYQVRGKWYYPKEELGYSKVGGASWYGDAFHGRLTANGEIYDMTHLTAAHPTMPLPSYARVTNKKNGASVIVRVNDRGPYAHGRIVDLSRKAAELLGYSHDGVATVQVDYVGRAPLDGKDESYLMASYQPGNMPADPSVGMPTGVMVAMNGASPAQGAPVRPFPGVLTDGAGKQDNILVLPSVAPVPKAGIAVASLGYGPETQAKPDGSIAALDRLTAGSREFIVAGSFGPEGAAIAKALARFGKVETVNQTEGGRRRVTVNLYSDGRFGIDDMLRAAWSHGAPDAMTVHD